MKALSRFLCGVWIVLWLAVALTMVAMRGLGDEPGDPFTLAEAMVPGGMCIGLAALGVWGWARSRDVSAPVSGPG